MVDLQTITTIFGGVSLGAASIYYVLNIRETSKNRRLTLTNNLMQFFTSVEGQRRAIELLTMEWADFDDFYKRYDSTVNPDNYAKRMSLWGTYEILGLQYRTGLLDMETIYAVGGISIINFWMRFRSIIEEYRKLDYGKDVYENWEYLANDLSRMKAQRDPSWKGSKSYIKPEEYDRAFEKRPLSA
jgi:hypothetical protein